MRLTFLCAASLLVANLFALERPSTVPPRMLDDTAALLDPIQVENLTLIPIVALGPTPDDGTLTLDEATYDRSLSITELGDGRVDALQFANGADFPVFLLAGELVIGGKQDRIVASTTVIPPHASQTVAVRCVEHGRWSGGDTFISAGRLAHDHLRGTAAYSAQDDVWEEVHRINAAHFTTNPTDTYRNLAELQPASVSSIERQVIEALAHLPDTDRERIIGYAVAYNGEVSSIDRFATPALLRKLGHKLLVAYAAEAIEQRIEGPPAKAPCIHAVQDFIKNAERGKVERMVSTPISRTVITRGTRAASSTVEVGERHLYSNYLGNVRIHDETPVNDWRHMSSPAARKLYPNVPGTLRFE